MLSDYDNSIIGEQNVFTDDVQSTILFVALSGKILTFKKYWVPRFIIRLFVSKLISETSISFTRRISGHREFPYDIKTFCSPIIVYTWSTSNSNIATVSQEGSITANGIGECVIEVSDITGFFCLYSTIFIYINN